MLASAFVGALPAYDAKLDWSANFARMLGFNDPMFDDLMRMYDQEHCFCPVVSLTPLPSQVHGDSLRPRRRQCVRAHDASGWLCTVRSLPVVSVLHLRRDCSTPETALSRYAAGMCGLAGPLHGLANQEVLLLP
jgi:hypothetical protein